MDEVEEKGNKVWRKRRRRRRKGSKIV